MMFLWNWAGSKLEITCGLAHRVPVEIVMSMGGHEMFHSCSIAPKYVQVNIDEVLVNLPLMIPAEEDKYVTLNDALGSSVLWFQGLTALKNNFC